MRLMGDYTLSVWLAHRTVSWWRRARHTGPIAPIALRPAGETWSLPRRLSSNFCWWKDNSDCPSSADTEKHRVFVEQTVDHIRRPRCRCRRHGPSSVSPVGAECGIVGYSNAVYRLEIWQQYQYIDCGLRRRKLSRRSLARWCTL